MLRPGLATAAAVIAADQLSKFWLIGWLAGQGGRVELTPFFNLVMVWNRGISFGLFQGGETGRWLLSALAVAISVALLVWLARVRRRLLAYGIGAVLGGAIGNVIDRVSPRGAVADFFDLHLMGYHWPAFNIADAAITTGVALILLDALREEREHRRTGVSEGRDQQG